MPRLKNAHKSALVPTLDDIRLAQLSRKRISPFVNPKKTVKLRVLDSSHPTDFILPPLAMKALANALDQLAEGKAVDATTPNEELTTQQAANLLNVSRPYLVKLIEEQQIPHRKVGTHRRILLCDLMAYKNSVDSKRRRVLDELALQAQELNMGY